MKKKLTQVHDKFEKYSSKVDHHNLEAKVNKLPTYDQIEELKSEVLDPMMQMHNRITDFSIDNVQLKSIVSQFDEHINLKANKHEFMEFRQEFRLEFVRKLEWDMF